MKTIKVDLDWCQGHGRCYAIAPEILQPFDDHGHAEFIGGVEESDEAAMKRAEQAIKSCPESALSWGEEKN
jgi:ferredoxin